MNILAVGDSFTAGCELADHILVPQHPGYFGPGQKRSEQLEATLQEWNKKFRLPVIDKQYSSSEVLSETQRLEKSFTYPNLLAKKLGCEVLNFAESGNSMWGITKSLYDYSLFNDVSNTIVFYQPTSIGRISQFDGRGHRTFLFSNFENYDTITQEMKTLLKLKIAMENDESLLIEWFKEYLS